MHTPFLLICSLVFYLTLQYTMVHSQQTELKFVAAVFRHGDRTPFVSETYPKHIYNNVSYGGYGPGELTDEGRRRMYQFGQQLKRMYKNSFRSNFTISNVKAVSTEYNRTKHSLQLVLNGLFDEDETYDVKKCLKQFNFETVHVRRTSLFSLPNELCPRYQQTYIEYQKSEEGKKLINKYSEEFSYISEHTGSEISCIEDLVPIYHSLKSDKEFGLELPTWSLSVQRYLKSAMGDLFESYVALPELNKLFGGMLLKEILNNIDAHIETPKNEKFYLYSCHDLHIAGLLGAMDIFRSHTPDYAACVVIELHKISTAYYVKVRYQENDTVGFRDMFIPGCNALCLLETFNRIVMKNIPEESGDACV